MNSKRGGSLQSILFILKIYINQKGPFPLVKQEVTFSKNNHRILIDGSNLSILFVVICLAQSPWEDGFQLHRYHEMNNLFFF